MKYNKGHNTEKGIRENPKCGSENNRDLEGKRRERNNAGITMSACVWAKGRGVYSYFLQK